MNANTNQAIYVELDCLLDTRLGTLRRVSSKETLESILEGDYQLRKADWWEQVDMLEYQRLWKARDTLTLAHSVPTNCTELVRHLVKLLIEQAVEMNSPYSGRVKIVVNTYPYQLTQDEMTLIGKALAVRFAAPAPVELISLSHTEMTPAYVRANFAMLVMYEYDPWLSLHYNFDPAKDQLRDFMKKLLLDVTLFAPAIYYKQQPSEEDEKQMTTSFAHPLEVIEQLGCTLIGLQLIDVTYFSIFRPATGHTPPTQAAAHSARAA